MGCGWERECWTALQTKKGADKGIARTDRLGGADCGLLLLPLRALRVRIDAMSAATGVAHLEGVCIWEELAAALDGAAADDVGDGGEGGEGVVLGGLVVDVLWIVAHRSAVARRRQRRSLDTPRTFNFWR